jgi:hypothetical protein
VGPEFFVPIKNSIFIQFSERKHSKRVCLWLGKEQQKNPEKEGRNFNVINGQLFSYWLISSRLICVVK